MVTAVSAFDEADLVCCVDFSSEGRLDEMDHVLLGCNLYPIFGIPFASFAYLSSVGCFALFSVLPVVICCYAYKWMEK